MSETRSIEIRCQSCEAWFPSPIFLGGSGTFDTSTLEGNIARCPACGVMTVCNKENMRVRFADGGFLGDDTM